MHGPCARHRRILHGLATTRTRPCAPRYRCAPHGSLRCNETESKAIDCCRSKHLPRRPFRSIHIRSIHTCLHQRPGFKGVAVIVKALDSPHSPADTEHHRRRYVHLLLPRARLASVWPLIRSIEPIEIVGCSIDRVSYFFVVRVRSCKWRAPTIRIDVGGLWPEPLGHAHRNIRFFKAISSGPSSSWP